jgi:hypothetical protein
MWNLLESIFLLIMPLVTVISNLLRSSDPPYSHGVLARSIITKAPTSGINEYAPLFPVMAALWDVRLDQTIISGNGY